MMATVPHVTSGLGLRKFQADGFLLTQVYKAHLEYGSNSRSMWQYIQTSINKKLNSLINSLYHKPTKKLDNTRENRKPRKCEKVNSGNKTANIGIT